MKKLFIILVLVSAVIHSFAQQYDLKLNMQPGQHFTQSLTTNLDIKENFSGQDVNITSRIAFNLSQTVKSITSTGNIVIESEYLHIIVEIDAMDQKIAYDSNKKDSSAANDAMKPYNEAFGKILGKKFFVTLSPSGNVIEIKGLKEISTAIEKHSKDVYTKKLIESTLDESKMASNFEVIYHIFPDKPVNIGDSWSLKSKTETIVPMELTTTYTLKEINNGVARIIASGGFGVKDGDFESDGVKMKMNLAGSCNGIYNMDIKTGLCNTSNFVMPVNGTLDIMGIEIPVSMHLGLLTNSTP